MIFYVHAYNAIYECRTIHELQKCILEIYVKSGEYNNNECIEIAEAIVLWAKYCGCPGEDGLSINGLVITTEAK